ncbi:DNA replication and repair protein RecF [Pandoraea aquatica]|uniref:DNA replication and repair protein RecF n=1 Tax=Pandoraea aquatica TaxID=2508290 RepID=A0A5E4V1X7_9BURK|nr:AAA family ATPase [Pandoraea aquatica]VVE06237.1 DNA replication and repair protein RecF [Pandoraea aquatica]
MPTIQKFTIENFKGIEKVEIDLEVKTTSPVLTLIGLNESGKTTILEALSHFISGDRSVASLFEGPNAKVPALGLIPMHKKAAFTGEIKISAEILLDSTDISDLEEIAKSQKLTINAAPLKKTITATKKYIFEDSALKETWNNWSISIQTKTARSKTFSPYTRPTKESGAVDIWLKCVNKIHQKLQQVSYFPTFLVDMPARIYLREHDDETPINRHYRFVFQDVLDSLGEGLELSKHVCARIEEFKKNEDTPVWWSIFIGSPDKGPIDSVFQKISAAITREVLGSWQRVFQRAISAKTISVEWNIDTEKGDLPYAAFYVSDGESRFAINERSLGFRWFFSFLLFTGFKKTKQRKTIFIFDEPAANLHAKAQAELLTSFAKIASNGNKIIYSTHSHHMINPRWLGAAYIVENSALDYDEEDSFGLDTKPTKITATPYRQFVSEFPTRSSYFQPVIEKLEYVPPEIVGSAPYLIVEGVSDYYALRLAAKLSKKDYRFNIIPGVGSGASGPIISQMLGQGQKFSILLDDDAEGRKAASKYKDDWFFDDTVVTTLGDIDKSFAGNAMEKLLGKETLEEIQRRQELPGKPSKKQIGWYLAEACGCTPVAAGSLPDVAVERLTRVLDCFEARFE